MGIAFFHKILLIISAYRNNNLFSGQTFHGYIDVGLWFVIFFDYFLNIFNVFCLKEWESFFYPQNFLGITISLSSLGIEFGLTSISLGQVVGFEVF